MTLLPISHGIHCWLITWDVTCTRTAKSKENTASFCRDGLGTASKVYVDTACFVCVSVYVCQSLKTRVSIQIQVPKYQENTFSNRWDREGRWDDLFDHWLASPRRRRILLLSFPLSRRLCLGHVQCLCKQFVDGRHMAGNVCSSFARFTHDMTRWTKEVDMTESLKLRSKYKARATSLKGFIKFHRAFVTVGTRWSHLSAKQSLMTSLSPLDSDSLRLGFCRAWRSWRSFKELTPANTSITVILLGKLAT